MKGDDVCIDISATEDDETGAFDNYSITKADGLLMHISKTDGVSLSSPKERKAAQPITPELCKRLFEDKDTISHSVSDQLFETSEIGSPLFSSTQATPELEKTVVHNTPSSTLPSTVPTPTETITLATYKASTPAVVNDVTPTAIEATTDKPLNHTSTPNLLNVSTPTDEQSTDERPDSNKTLNNTVNVDKTITQEETVSNDMRYLFATIGELLEHSKTATTQLQEIPTLINSVNKLREEIKHDVAELSRRMLIVEEDVKKISSAVFTDKGKSIAKTNKTRITALEQQNKSLDQNISSLREELKDLDARYEKSVGENSILVASLQHRSEDPNNNTVAYDGWDESRITELETQIRTLQNQLQQQQQQVPTTSASNKQQVPPRSQQKRTKPPPTYKDHTVKKDGLLLMDSNGKPISAGRINHPGGVQRHTCYTLQDVATFLLEAKIEKHPSKLYLQVGTNDLTQHGDVQRLLHDLGETIRSLKEKFPSCRIYISHLLPRKDELNTLVREFNKSLEQVCDSFSGLRIVSHLDLNRSDLFDNLHLHEDGFYKFLWNIKRDVFGIPPPRYY